MPGRRYGTSAAEQEASSSEDPARLARLAEHSSSFTRSAAGKNPRTPPESLAVLAETGDSYNRSAVAANPSTPPRVLLGLSGDSDAYVRGAVARNLNAAAETLTRLAGDADERIQRGLTYNPATPPEALRLLAGSPHQRVRVGVAKHSATPEDVVLALLRGDDAEVRAAVGRRNRQPDGPTATRSFRRFNGRFSETVTRTFQVEQGGRFSAEMIWEFVRGNDQQLMFRAVTQPDAPVEALRFAALRTENANVLRVIAENPAATTALLDTLVARVQGPVFREHPKALPQVLEAAVKHPNASDHLMLLAATSRSDAMRAVVWERPGGREWMMGHDDKRVRVGAARCYAVQLDRPVEMLHAFLADTEGDVQVAAIEGCALADVPVGENHQNGQVRKMVARRSRDSALLLRLAEDSYAPVRREVAANRHAGVDVFALLAHDRDARVRAKIGERFLETLQ